MHLVLNLHILAAEVLVAYTRAKGIAELLRCPIHTLRSVNTIAMEVSGMIRRDLGHPIIEVEERACDGSVLDITRDPGEV